MASITLGGNPTTTNGTLPEIGKSAPNFSLIGTDMNVSTLADYKGSKVILNIFPSVDTGVCAASVRHFNERASTPRKHKSFVHFPRFAFCTKTFLQG